MSTIRRKALAILAAVAVPSASFGSDSTIEWSAAVMYENVRTPIVNEGSIALPPGMTYAGWSCVLQKELRLKTGQFSRSIVCGSGNAAVITTAACRPVPHASDNGYLRLVVGDESIGLFVFCDVRGAGVAGVSL